MKKQRLLKLADFIEKLPRRKLEMDLVATTDRGNPLGAIRDPKLMDPVKCKSAACMMGWTPAVFPRSMRWVPSRTGRGYMQVESKEKKHLRERDHDAMARFFDIPYEHAEVLFRDRVPGKYETPKQVARALRQYVRTGRVPRATGFIYVKDDQGGVTLMEVD